MTLRSRPELKPRVGAYPAQPSGRLESFPVMGLPPGFELCPWGDISCGKPHGAATMCPVPLCLGALWG